MNNFQQLPNLKKFLYVALSEGFTQTSVEQSQTIVAADASPSKEQAKATHTSEVAQIPAAQAIQVPAGMNHIQYKFF